MRMSLEDLRERVADANHRIHAAGVVTMSFGNASGVDRDRGVLAIKPSGVPCDRVDPGDVVLVSLRDGTIVEGAKRPSSDTPTHLVLYRRLDAIGGVVHTHSPFASAWAQAHRSIPVLGTTHADHWGGPVPVTRALTPREIGGEYERVTGEVIVETLRGLGADPLHAPGALVAAHGPFTWGADPAEAATNAIALELIAKMALRTLELSPDAGPIEQALLDRHFRRKHGPDAYYGQPPDRD
jgi:L-ribulose-5-phosphate 4-epimerase